LSLAHADIFLATADRLDPSATRRSLIFSQSRGTANTDVGRTSFQVSNKVPWWTEIKSDIVGVVHIQINGLVNSSNT